MSFDPRPYRPPTIRTPPRPTAASAVTTSWYSGSPMADGSLQRSSTTTFRAVAGRAAAKRSDTNGRYSRTLIRPTFSPCAHRWSTTSSAVLQTDPIATSTVSASGAP